MTQLHRSLALLLCLLLAGCAGPDRYSFLDYSQHPEKYGLTNPVPALALSDQLVLLFSSNVAAALRAKATGSRITREVSSSTQVALAGLAGAGAAFNFSNSTLAVLGLGSAGIPEFQGIFNARGRAEAYSDAVRLIESAQNEYLAHNQKPSATYLTQNGVTMLQRVQASIHVVEKTLAGRLPTIHDMAQATERMSAAGAYQRPAGVAVNNIPANATGVILKPPLPSASQPQAFNSSNKDADTTEVHVDVQADQRLVASWITAKAKAGDFAAIESLLLRAGVRDTVQGPAAATRARHLVREATNRTRIDLLLTLIDSVPQVGPGDPPKVVDPPVTHDPQKPAFPGASQPGAGDPATPAEPGKPGFPSASQPGTASPATPSGGAKPGLPGASKPR